MCVLYICYALYHAHTIIYYTHYVYTGKEHAYPWAHPYDEIKEVIYIYSVYCR